MRRPPGPKNLFYLKNMLALQRQRLNFIRQLSIDYGDVNYAQIGRMDFYFFHHPDAIRDILVTHDKSFSKGIALQKAKVLLGEGLLTSEGALHQTQRRLIQPSFHRERIVGYAQTMVELTQQMMARWKDHSQIDIHDEMMRLTMQIVAQTLFGQDVSKDADAISESLGELIRQFPRLTNPLAPLLDRLPLPSTLRWKAARKHLDSIIYGLIKDHREKKGDSNDLLSMLLSAQDEENKGAGMSDQQVRDEVMTLFLAGHETTANALSWTWYLLGLHPEIEEKVAAEVQTVLDGKTPSFADVSRLPYLAKVFSESMRLFPPAWIIGRRALTDLKISGYTVPAGTIVIISPYVVHHQERYFPDPEKFDPERWTEKLKATRPKFSYFPFSAGSRSCIGEAFAWTEGILLLATIAQQWKLKLRPNQTIGMLPMITLRPDRPIWMDLVKRQVEVSLQS